MNEQQRKAMELALEALTATMSTHGFRDAIDEVHEKAITAIKEALSSPNGEAQPEPLEGLKLIHQADIDLAKKRALEAQPEQEPWLLETTQTLAKHMARKFYPEVTQWQCFDNLAGVISQIDNMTTGLMRKPEQRSVSEHLEPMAYINVEQRKLEWANKYMSWHTPTVVNLPKIPLYTTPPQRTWVGLDEKDDIDWEEGGSLRDLVEAVEAKLKEKNNG